MAVRAFFGPPNVFATVYKLGIIEWIDLTVSNSDETRECWSSQVMHDGITPPWVTFQLLPAADFSTLLDRMVSEHSGKAPAVYTQVDFVDAFVDAYEKEMAWRLSDKAEMEQIEEEAGDLDTVESLAKDLYDQARDLYSYSTILNRDILKQLEKQAKNGPLSDRACDLMRGRRDSVNEENYFYDDEEAKQQLRIDALVGDDRTRSPFVPKKSGRIK